MHTFSKIPGAGFVEVMRRHFPSTSVKNASQAAKQIGSLIRRALGWHAQRRDRQQKDKDKLRLLASDEKWGAGLLLRAAPPV
jgi:hypothetical protein